jgi:hypothetical protein
MKKPAMTKVLHVLLLSTLLAAGAASAQAPAMFVVHFEIGPSWDKSLPPAEQKAFKEHSANLGRLRKDGIIAFGARYADVGMIFVKADSLEAARSMIDADPGVRAGTFVYRVDVLNVFYPWQP